jgi:hypothetical protein
VKASQSAFGKQDGIAISLWQTSQLACHKLTEMLSVFLCWARPEQLEDGNMRIFLVCSVKDLKATHSSL